MNTLDTAWQEALKRAGMAPEWVQRGREAARARLLIVADDGFDFSSVGPRGLGRLLDTLSRSGPDDAAPLLRLASRSANPGMPLTHDGLTLDVEQQFDFAWADPPVTTEHVDQIWCFCSDTGRPLSADEQAVLAVFSQAGGGVLVTGAHGPWPLAQHWPRVQRMQRWREAAAEPLEAPEDTRMSERLLLATVAPQFRLMADASGVWQWRPHELLVYEPRLLCKTLARQQAPEWISMLPEWPHGRHSEPLRAGLHPTDSGDIETVARACLEVPLRAPVVTITAMEGQGEGTRAGRTRAGRVVCDATAAHFTHAEPHGLERRVVDRARAARSEPVDDRQWAQARLQTTAYVINVLHWIQPLPRQCLRVMWDLILLCFHPRLAAMACDTPAARQALGFEAHALWMEWRGSKAQNWMTTLAHAAGAEPADGSPYWIEDDWMAGHRPCDRALGEALAYLRRSLPAGRLDPELAPAQFDPARLLAALNAAVRVGLTPPPKATHRGDPPSMAGPDRSSASGQGRSSTGSRWPRGRAWRPRWLRWITEAALHRRPPSALDDWLHARHAPHAP